MYLAKTKIGNYSRITCFMHVQGNMGCYSTEHYDYFLSTSTNALTLKNVGELIIWLN